jgi:predicted ester cyclase
MKPTDILREHWKAIEEKNFEKARGFLSEDFTFSGPVPKPIGTKEYIDVHRSLLQGIPDWRFNANIVGEQQDKVAAKVRVTGTHTANLSLPFLGDTGTIQPTGKKLALPEEKVEVVIKGDKISRMTVEHVPGGGVPGLLNQMGVSPKG